MKRIAILGSTGSIGRAALEIAGAGRGDIEIVGLSAGGNVDELARQLQLFPRAVFTLGQDDDMARMATRHPSLASRSRGTGREGIEALIVETGPDLVVNALVGIAGLGPTVTALEAGCAVALANKETLVSGGKIVMDIVRDRPDMIIPVDSEHFSLSRCLCGNRADAIELVLTASGGPFFKKDRQDLEKVTVEEALNHPTWRMGRKVTIDSANLLNKGMEVMEAHWLFGFGLDSINVVIHPQSIVHSLVRMRDGSFLAHLGPADMKLPLMSSMYHPEIREFPWENLRIEDIGRLDFIPLDEGKFPAFGLALEAAKAGGTAPAVLNAADEAAVSAFLSGRIGFLEITDWIEEALGAHEVRDPRCVEDVMDADRWTREFLRARHG